MTRASASSTALCLILGTILLSLTGQCHGALKVGFYKDKCRSEDVELIVRRVVLNRMLKDKTIAAALLRMHFHDCFVNGCDASILLDGDSSEKRAPPNLSVRGYDVIDEAKKILEAICPGVVSCADIIAIAARDSVSLRLGGTYAVETGRRDGLKPGENVDLPSPFITVQQSIDAFARKGLSYFDMVLLLGGHSIGDTHCALIIDRLYNFNNTGKPDPTMEKTLLNDLRSKCPQNSTANVSIKLDQGAFTSLEILGTSFYQQIKRNRGVLKIDQEIALESPTKPIVDAIATGNLEFRNNFGRAMIKMGAIQVLTYPNGQIRKSCSAVNKA